MKLLKRSLLVLSSLLVASSSAAAADRPINTRLFGTRAIIACDPVEKSCGMAVITFPSGASGLVPYGRPDVAVASMSVPSVDDANAIIARIDKGEAPQAAIDNVLAVDPEGSIRQFAAVKLHPDGTVTVGQRTGSEANPFTCAVKGSTFVVQANNMTVGSICDAMVQGFQQTRGSLPQRMLASLKAGARVGGDKNGERSGVIRVWNNTSASAPYTHVLAEATVHGSMTALRDLEVQLIRHQAGIAPPYAADLVVLDRDTARFMKRSLRRLGYYDGPMDGSWSAGAEQALADFTWNNIFHDKPTVVENGVRKIDGVLVRFLANTDLDVLLPASAE
ncbi:DUF1028 domain-containing protein [Pyxidicoccus fallax]|uniref:DUF1028 domain-containing protein n=1 Tax=Pyxidicoccus fallax TaxID=394095 RepID=A0A848LPY3_9BACT|nr:DUF1028 domain-containing protein [Pyxidicoccus fallax]NMO19702.1 DUF1028 domain-containing protein [Pyxidicoccus fallax]NPC81261.1 DUF1028 domain-containing protein [Pyxidicoccus fallax]